MDSNTYIKSLVEANALREPVLRKAIQSLALPSGSHGIDVCCGAGLQCLLLADAAAPGGRVTGMDLSQDMIEYGRKMVEDAGLSDRIDFKQGDAASIPFGDNTFDWAWSADAVGYTPMQPVELLKEMVRVVRPGGTVAITAWSSEKLLPGYPRLEARL
ncbi:MAG: class I SAM-dependent methyltransferase [Dehalococcoidales bacterium]|nr:class I SAM-dependent methyltransferase [Dehalococcoidales bacterium]